MSHHGSLVKLPDQVRALVAGSPWVPVLQADRDDLGILAQGLERAASSTERPLRILLLGGTGAGKSTLLNALAGEAVAEVGPIRPTTRRPTIYLHSDDPTPDLGGLEAQASVRTHQRPELRSKAVVDLPDPDSGVEENALLLEQALRAADLVILVSTPEKYLSAVLFDLLRLYQTGREFLFVLNKLDEAGPDGPEVTADLAGALRREGFQQEPLALSARSAYRNRTGGVAEPEGDFPRLERAIGAELDRVRARRIRERNLQSRAAALLTRLRGHLPADRPVRAVEWRLRAAAEAETVLDQAGGAVIRRLEETPRLRELQVRRAAGSFRSLFGFAAALLLGLRGLLQGTLASPAVADGQAGALADEVLPPREAERLSRGLVGVVQSFVLGARELDLSDQVVAELVKAELATGWESRLLDRARRELAEELEALLERRPPVWIGWLGNLVAWGAALGLAGRILWDWLAGAGWNWDAVTGGAVLLTVLLALEVALAKPALDWWARRHRRGVHRRLAAALRAAYTEEVAGVLDRTVTAVMAPWEELDRLERGLPSGE